MRAVAKTFNIALSSFLVLDPVIADLSQQLSEPTTFQCPRGVAIEFSKLCWEPLAYCIGATRLIPAFYEASYLVKL